MKQFYTLLFCGLPLLSPLAFGQISVSGKITDPTGTPLPGASVILSGTDRGTVADADGIYLLKLPAGKQTLTVSYVGFESQRQAVDGRAVVDFVLLPSPSQMDEVVVVGFGVQQRRELTSSISSVGEEVFENVSVPVFQRALQGQLPGVVVTNASGGLDAESIIRIRGVGSISAGNQPLIVLDGMVLSSQPGPESMGYGLNPMLAIDPNDIASVEVLKDAAATAIYGSRGGNGVILLKTKSGSFGGQPKVSLGSYAGFSEISKSYDLLDGQAYAALYNQAAMNVGDTLLYDVAAQPTTDWQELLLRKGFVQETSASVTGGTSSTRYAIAGSFRQENSYLRTVGLQRSSLRANIEQRIGERVQVGLSVNPSRVVNDRVGNQWAASPFAMAAWYPPNVQGLDENGDCLHAPLTTSIGKTGFIGGPCITLENYWLETTTNQLLSQMHLKWSPLPDLTFRTELGSQFNEVADLLRFGQDTWFGGESGRGSEQHQQLFTYTWSSQADWETGWGRGHALHSTVGVQLTEESFRYTYVAFEGFADDRLRSINSASTVTYHEGVATSSAFAGYFARLNYNWQGRYLLGLSARYDGSSRFGTSSRYGFFPAVSAGWVISQADFFKPPFVDFLKIRTSFGLSGNAEIGDFARRGLVAFGPAYAGQPGFVISSIENENLGWEKSLQWDVGLDFSLWKNRLRGSFDYFRRDTRDLLLEVPVPATNGVSIFLQNVGEVRNQGFEFELEADLLTPTATGGSFSWSVRAVGATLKNEVRRLADTDNDGHANDIVLNSRMLFREGESVGSFFLVKYAGVDPANGDALFFDLAGNTVANSAPASNRQVLGKSLPSFTGGFEHLLRYRGFDLRAFFHFKTGFYRYLEEKGLEANMTWGDNQLRSQLDAWTPANPITDVPQARLESANGTQESSRYLRKADYLRLNHLALGYTFREIGSVGARLRVFVAAQNLFTVTGFSGLDPDSEFFASQSAAQGAVRYNLPAARTFTAGANLDF